MAKRRHRTSDRFRQPIPKISFAFTGIAVFVTVVSSLILISGIGSRPDYPPFLSGLCVIFGMLCIYCTIRVWGRLKTPEDTFMKLACVMVTTVCALLHIGVYVLGLVL